MGGVWVCPRLHGVGFDEIFHLGAGGQQGDRLPLILAVDLVDGEALGFVEEERLVDAAGEVMVEGGLVVGAGDEDVFAVGDAVGVVVDGALVAVEGEAVDHVAFDILDGDDFFAGCGCGDLAGERTGGVVEVELRAVEAEQEDEQAADGDKRDVANLGDAEALHHCNDHGGSEEGSDAGDDEPGARWDEGFVLHVLRSQREDEDEDGAERGVGVEKPGFEAGAASAVKVVAGKDGERRDGREDVAGKLRAGEGEEEDGEDGPEDEELGEGVAGAGVAEITDAFAANAPLGDGSLDGVDEGAQAENGPGHEADDEHREVVPGGLMVHVLVGGEAFEIVLEEEFAIEGGVAALDGDVPGQNHHKVEDEAGKPNRPAKQRPLAAESREEEDDEQREKRRDGALGEGGGCAEKVKVEQPEFLARFVPGVPAEHPDTEGCGELHIGGGAAGEAEDGKDETVMRAASRWPPGRKRRMWRKMRKTRKAAPEVEGSRADQSETPNSRKKPSARQ